MDVVDVLANELFLYPSMHAPVAITSHSPLSLFLSLGNDRLQYGDYEDAEDDVSVGSKGGRNARRGNHKKFAEVPYR
jgi:hypothetical protein